MIIKPEDGFDWEYEPDESPRRKHKWSRDEHGFVEQNGVVVAKCPDSLTNEKARELLNSGVGWRDEDWPHDHPNKIYGVYRGVVYRATPTIPGRSYHGFPEVPSRMPRKRELQEAIIELARNEGTEDEVRKWLKRRR